MLNKQSDIEIATLIKGLKKGRHDCFKSLFELYSRPLYIFSFRYLKCNELAEDVVQDAFIKVWHRRKFLDTSKSFKSYLFTIAFNSIRKHFNKASESILLKLNIMADATEECDTIMESDEFDELLENLELFINKMPEKRRDIFRKKKIECKSLKEIAEEYSISTKAVEYHITESMKFLRQEFEKLII